jgi:putative transposase
MSKIAPKITLTEKQKTILTAMSTSRSIAKSRVVRAQIILYASEGMQNKEISSKVPLNRLNVGLWRRRWAEAENVLFEIEKKEKNTSKYKQRINEILTDFDRPGAPATFTPEQICQILSVACEKPENSGIPLSHWSLCALKAEVIKRGIVKTISPAHLGNFLKSREY